MLPITPPPNGWAFRLPEQPMAGVRPAEGPGAAAYREGLGGKMRRPGVSRESTGFGGPRHAWVVASGSRPGRGCRRCRHRLSGAGRGRRPRRQGHTRPGPDARPDGDRQRPWPPEVPQGQPPDLVRHRVHRRRPGPDEPGHGHPALRHLERPCPPGRSQRLVQLPVPPHDGHHRRRLLRHGRPHHVRHRRRGRPGSGHGRAHHLQGRRRPRPPRRPRADRQQPFRRRAATPGGCSR